MQSRIVFNGKEYAGIEQMPDDVRKAFLAAVAQIGADADGNRIPDAFEGQGNVVGLEQSSITVNGRSIESLRNLPLPVRWMLGQALRRVPPDLGVEAAPPPPPRDPLLRQLDATAGVLRTVLYLLSTFMAAGLATIGIWVIIHMDASARSQGGAFYVGIGVAVALAWMVGSMISLVMGRR